MATAEGLCAEQLATYPPVMIAPYARRFAMPARVRCPLPLLLLLTLFAGPASAATVVSVGDGDTLRVTEAGQRLTIRLACIDAPEKAQAPYGETARQQLQQLAPLGSQLTLKAQTTDRYGRTVGELFRDGKSINLAMVASGNAFAYRKYLSACNGQAYLAAERSAESRRLGVWAVSGGIQRPWDWRHGGKAAGAGSVANWSISAPVSSSNDRQVSAPASGSRYTCRQIGNYAKAQELLKQGHTYLDRDGDGMACESLR